ncbi:MAG: DUF86 domain-containing protein [Acidobacteria bacterium]|nr:DUF86 domain-containing protein [Acidobacteriota bacterium]
MRDHAAEAIRMVQSRSREELDTDRTFALALTRLLEIIGEAANRVPREEQGRHPDVPWAAMSGLRNRLIHAYDDVDHTIIWRIVREDLPLLVAVLDRILGGGG